MEVTLEELMAMYSQELLDNYAALRHSVIRYSPLNMLGSAMGKLKNGKVDGIRVFPMTHGVAVQFVPSAPTFVPTKTANPNEYLKSVVQLIAKFGGVSNVPHHFADHLGKMGYKLTKRPWGNRDYVFETKNIADLPSGKYKKDRYYVRRGLEQVEFRPLTTDDHAQVLELEAKWRDDFTARNPTVSIGGADYLSRALKMAHLIPDCYRPTFLGAFNKDDGKLVIATGASLISSDTWANAYRYALTGEIYSGATLAMNVLAKDHFYDIPWESDGDAGGTTTGLVAYKDHFMSEASADKQQYYFIVQK